eukprot:CAMPEP_0174275410 /NCGR_PEP_ID=MMETSP0439-20130205/59810_1 /TAXON_ID=0 /ORGANISM="Stereomyxa ramosa, Strain Chinc5" /LENGTH=362 /DNA_ID=CAMNT_0015367511 /DNA_START=15 /DNA_END=1103 /DNA_ORIENTATION=+
MKRFKFKKGDTRSKEEDLPPVDGVFDKEDSWDIDFDDLVFGDVIGGGAFGVVYYGEYYGTPVAIKQLDENVLSAEQTRKYVEREISMLKNIHHPNIVQFMGLCRTEQHKYLVTEFIAGGDLKDFLEQNAWISWKQKLIMGRDIAYAMNFLHHKGLIHRDMKPENLLITEHGRIKVCDLGFARRQQRDYMTIAGSDDYMAPEVLVGDRYNEKCDVFGFGIVFGVILLRRKLPERTSMDGFGFTHEQLENFFPKGCPPKLKTLVLDCCNFHPDDRPTFEEVLLKLRKYISEVDHWEEEKDYKRREAKMKKMERQKRQQQREKKNSKVNQEQRSAFFEERFKMKQERLIKKKSEVGLLLEKAEHT